MTDLMHRVKVFVFRQDQSEPNYLLLRGAGLEGFWGPLHGNLGFGEKLESAVHREVLDDVGIAKPDGLIDLKLPNCWTVGDEQVVEWTFGYRIPAAQEPSILCDRFAELRWADFHQAYPCLELEPDRVAIMRLHTLLFDAA